MVSVWMAAMAFDLLFEIDPADYHAAVEQAKAQVLAAKAASTQRK
jgi:multidrug resistance efflux pump